ncbi:MBL fold metallo-hydrolase [Pseudoalteromonas sp. S4492]|uniref:MBL fold metallo-hydrolase n=1 Tax=Pseudoalteromonas sp. S4492 TaxID=579560 RepID=UPI00110ACEC4|nr:MBL fold metallo-hydrolase [Pseudoalteromonas sp. S4492]TMO29567.1 MBL fold metallo-hydrolase [Pseudoalteromonas sp. S4492]
MKVLAVPVTGFAQNCRIIICEQTNKAALLDPGGDAEKLQAELAALNCELEAIYLTHGHLDHVGAAKQLADHFSVDIIGPHLDDKFWFDALPMQAQMFGFAAIAPFYPTKWLAHGDTITVGELALAVRHCPGHTPGHVVFYHQDSEQLIVGDVIFQGSVGRTDFPKGDSAQLLKSIKSEILSFSDNVAILPGHGPNTTVGHERRTNPFISGRFG